MDRGIIVGHRGGGWIVAAYSCREANEAQEETLTAADDTRPFPIQSEWNRTRGRWGRADASTIPWWLAQEAYEFYAARYGKSQSLERLAERGGFGREELLSLIRRIE